jgi:hypothetical protein
MMVAGRRWWGGWVGGGDQLLTAGRRCGQRRLVAPRMCVRVPVILASLTFCRPPDGQTGVEVRGWWWWWGGGSSGPAALRTVARMLTFHIDVYLHIDVSQKALPPWPLWPHQANQMGADSRARRAPTAFIGRSPLHPFPGTLALSDGSVGRIISQGPKAHRPRTTSLFSPALARHRLPANLHPTAPHPR